MKKLFDLIKTDLITMNGGKNNMKSLVILMVVFCCGGGFCISPIAAVYAPLLMGSFFVQMIFQNEIKYRSEKLWGLLPVSRRDLVSARFVFVLVFYTVSSLLFYLLMLFSLYFKPYYLFFGEDAEDLDIIALLSKYSGDALTELGVFNLVYIAGFAYGLLAAAGTLRNYFNDPERLATALSFSKAHKSKQKDYGIEVLIFSAILLLWALIVSGILPIGPAAAVILQLFVQLAGAANGFILSAVLVTMAAFSAIYKYICTVLEYDEKEL